MLRTVKNVKWLSGPPGKAIDTNGAWQVVAMADSDIGKNILLCKDEIMISIPPDDLYRVGEYNFDKVISDVKRVKSLKDLGDTEDGKKRTG